MEEELKIDKSYPGVRKTEHGAYLELPKERFKYKKVIIDGVRVICYGLDQGFDSLHLLNGGSLFGKRAVIGELIFQGNNCEVTFSTSLTIEHLSIRGSWLCSISCNKQVFVNSVFSVTGRSFFYFLGNFNLPNVIEISKEADVSANTWIKNGQILEKGEAKALGLSISNPVRSYPSCEVD